MLDRPLRFVVIRGQRGAIRADSLEELQETLDQPWSPDEIEDSSDAADHSRVTSVMLAALRPAANGIAAGRGRALAGDRGALEAADEAEARERKFRGR